MQDTYYASLSDIKTSSYFFCSAFATFSSEYFLVGKPFSIFVTVWGAKPAFLASSAMLKGIASRNCLTLFFFTFILKLENLYPYIGFMILKINNVK